MSFASGLNQSGVVGQIPNAVNGLMAPAAPVGGTTMGPDAATVAGQNSMNQWGQPADPGTAALVNAAFNPANTMQAPINPVAAMESGGPVPGTRAMPVVRRNAGSRTAGPQLMRGPASGVNPATMQSPEDPGTPMLARGGIMPVNRGAIPMRAATPGGVVPGLQAGGALPAGPEQGIVPASTEGQVLTMDAGGQVPGFEQTTNMPIQQAQVAQPAVAGGRAGLVSGIASGQVIGNNLLNAWHQHEQREIAADAAPGMESTVTGISQTPETSPLDAAKNSVEQFFHHLHGGLLDDNHLPNSNQGTPGPYNPTGAANPIPGGGPSPYGPPAPAGIPTGGSASPAPGTAPAPPGAAPGGPAPAPAAPGGQPAPQGTPPVAPNGPPAGQGGNAFTATQNASTLDAVKAAASDPAAQQGIPQKSPAQSGQEHSLSPDWYEHSEQLKMKAMHDAALAGEDPMKVGAAMDALRTGAVQGQVMRNYAAANAAFASGDDKALKQALQNVNYYLPNGKGIDIKTATAADVKANDALAHDPLTGQPKPGYDPNMHPGALMYKSPFAGMAGHENDPPYTTVTQQHISMLAQNALDPSTVQKSMLASYTAQRETQAKLMSAQGALATGQGRLEWGNAQLMHAQTQADYDKATTPTRVALMRSQADYNEAHANQAMAKVNAPAAGGVKVTLPAVRAAQNDAIKTVDEAVQGPMTPILGQIPRVDPRTGQPMMGPNGQPLMTINASPGAGHSVRDPTKADPLFQGMRPEDVSTVKDYAGALAGANVGITNPQEVASAAARIVRYDKQPTFHIDPATKKQVPDVVRDQDQGTVHVWDGHQMHNFYTRANISDSGASPVSSDNDNGPAGGNPADNAPAVEAGGAAEADAINGQ